MTQIDTKSDPTAKLVFDILAERNRHRQRTDIKNLFRMAQKIENKLDYPSFLEVFKKLQANDVGSLIIGRRGNPDRFVWNYNLKAFANKVKANGLNPTTLKQLDLVTDAKLPINAVKRATRRPVKNATKGMRRGRKPRLMASKSESQVNTAGPLVLNINLGEMSLQDRQAFVELLAGVKK